MTEDLRKIDRVIVRYFLNEADAAEQEHLLNWLKESKQNRHHFFAFKDTWEKSQRNIPAITRTGDSWNSLIKQIERGNNQVTSDNKKQLTMRLLKYAAAIILLCVLGISAYVVSRRFMNNTEPAKYTEIITENGQKKEITLPDGSKVWLNSGTSFKYADDYGKINREVYLLGEAFFSVTRDESKTFIVKADDITIKVLGTTFNVNCYPGNKVVETTVISGVVSIENDNRGEGSNIVILNKLEKGTYIKDEQRMLIRRNMVSGSVEPIALKKIPLSEEESGYIASWKDQTLSFNNETFEEMAVKLQRWFNVTIQIQDDNLKKFRYKGKFENVRSIFQVLEVVKLATPITYEYNEKSKEIIIKESTH